MRKKPTPPEFMSPMGQAALGLHVMFQSYVEGGFTEDQALRLIAYQMAAQAAEAEEEGEPGGD